MEGMYALVFRSGFDGGGGVIVLETGRVFGGDTWMHYIGEYSVKDHQFEARVKVGRHLSGGQSVFGPIFDAGQSAFHVILSGRGKNGVIEVTGYVEEAPTYKLEARLEKISDLP